MSPLGVGIFTGELTYASQWMIYRRRLRRVDPTTWLEYFVEIQTSTSHYEGSMKAIFPLLFYRRKMHITLACNKYDPDPVAIRTPPNIYFEERRRNKKSSSFSLRPSVPRRMHKECQTPYETEDDDDDGCCQKNGERGGMDVG